MKKQLFAWIGLEFLSMGFGLICAYKTVTIIMFEKMFKKKNPQLQI